ncbi:hypothetical protein VIGAN_05185900 [Vigna angularis var. angularis]|uniref:Uncharacterized protein n=1 Tax=Vigna angularis var. angularis TaxID=157739 RepID=A0A0S3S6H0_PHAAN|nr:hypothetical protein VIGAN_05185900 [Vigna angularis var. angularis]
MSSFPSAMQRSSRRRVRDPLRAALDLTTSRYSSNLARIFGLLWILRMRVMVGEGLDSGQPDLKMIWTML